MNSVEARVDNRVRVPPLGLLILLRQGVTLCEELGSWPVADQWPSTQHNMGHCGVKASRRPSLSESG